MDSTNLKSQSSKVEQIEKIDSVFIVIYDVKFPRVELFVTHWRLSYIISVADVWLLSFNRSRQLDIISLVTFDVTLVFLVFIVGIIVNIPCIHELQQKLSFYSTLPSTLPCIPRRKALPDAGY